MTKKRIRIFAGPNGSGKTSLAHELVGEGKFSPSVFVNADEIEKEIKETSCLDFDRYNIQLDLQGLCDFFYQKGMSISKLNDRNIPLNFYATSNRLYYKSDINSYITSDLAAYIRKELLFSQKGFWFETVFSHSSKLDLMVTAKKLGYKVYFYFIATDSPEINVDRVKVRVKKAGHDVPHDKIISRYYRSLELLIDAIKVSDRAFLFDNSNQISRLICEVTDGNRVEMHNIDKGVPNWFVEYVYNKSKTRL